MNLILGPLCLDHQIKIITLIEVLSRYEETKGLSKFIDDYGLSYWLIKLPRETYFRQSNDHMMKKIHELAPTLYKYGFANDYTGFFEGCDITDCDVQYFKSLHELVSHLDGSICSI